MQIEQEIQAVKRGRKRSLLLRDKNLRHLPESILTLPKLKSLDLKGNSIERFPKEIRNLKNLSKLILSDGKLPIGIEFLENLVELNIDNCELKELPLSITTLKTLRKLHVNNNLLEKLPKELGKLMKLELLSINNNRLTNLPFTLSEMTNLTGIYLSRNNFKEFPPQLFSLPNLITLDLSDNQIETVPDHISRLKSLKALSLNDNDLNELALEILRLPELRSLMIRNNSFDFSEYLKSRSLKKSSFFHLENCDVIDVGATLTSLGLRDRLEDLLTEEKFKELHQQFLLYYKKLGHKKRSFISKAETAIKLGKTNSTAAIQLWEELIEKIYVYWSLENDGLSLDEKVDLLCANDELELLVECLEEAYTNIYHRDTENETDHRKELRMQKGTLKRLKSDKRTGEITRDHYDIARRKLHSALLDLYDEIRYLIMENTSGKAFEEIA